MSRDIEIVHIEETRRRRITENTKIVRYMKLETLLLMLAEGGFLSRALRLWEDPTAWRSWFHAAGMRNGTAADFAP